MSSYQYLKNKTVRGAILWLQLQHIIQNVVEIIMMPPQQTEEYLLKNTFGHMIFKQGRYFANDFICSMQALIWHQIIAERYSYTMDYFYVACLRIFIHSVPMVIMSLISYSAGYITLNTLFQQTLFNSQWFDSQQSCYETLGINTQMCIIMLSLYHISFKIKVNRQKLYIGFGIISLIIRTIIICVQYLNNQLYNYSLRYLADSNTVSQLYHYCIGFAFGEYLNKFQLQSKMLYNQPIKTKAAFKIPKEINYTIYGLSLIFLLLFVYVDSYTQLQAETLLRNTRQLLLVRLTIKPLFSFIIWIIVIYQEIQFASKRNLSPIKYSKQELITIPGYTQSYFSLLSSQPISALIIVSVGQTVIGPYHPKIFIMLAIGVLVFQHFFGLICMTLFNWFIQSIYKSILYYFDSKKRLRISKLIKESIYSGAE
ncbi:Conserved_hypothetical protein [Hexamita inflata]|uniref:Uncharacterized protein n=1 Tax=Hexamita inflata TaxID=28002 RepID=A0ABP1H962_9EUKA